MKKLVIIYSLITILFINMTLPVLSQPSEDSTEEPLQTVFLSDNIPTEFEMENGTLFFTGSVLSTTPKLKRLTQKQAELVSEIATDLDRLKKGLKDTKKLSQSYYNFLLNKLDLLQEYYAKNPQFKTIFSIEMDTFNYASRLQNQETIQWALIEAIENELEKIKKTDSKPVNESFIKSDLYFALLMKYTDILKFYENKYNNLLEVTIPNHALQEDKKFSSFIPKELNEEFATVHQYELEFVHDLLDDYKQQLEILKQITAQANELEDINNELLDYNMQLLDKTIATMERQLADYKEKHLEPEASIKEYVELLESFIELQKNIRENTKTSSLQNDIIKAVLSSKPNNNDYKYLVCKSFGIAKLFYSETGSNDYKLSSLRNMGSLENSIIDTKSQPAIPFTIVSKKGAQKINENTTSTFKALAAGTFNYTYGTANYVTKKIVDICEGTNQADYYKHVAYPTMQGIEQGKFNSVATEKAKQSTKSLVVSGVNFVTGVPDYLSKKVADIYEGTDEANAKKDILDSTIKGFTESKFSDTSQKTVSSIVAGSANYAYGTADYLSKKASGLPADYVKDVANPTVQGFEKGKLNQEPIQKASEGFNTIEKAVESSPLKYIPGAPTVTNLGIDTLFSMGKNTTTMLDDSKSEIERFSGGLGLALDFGPGITLKSSTKKLVQQGAKKKSSSFVKNFMEQKSKFNNANITKSNTTVFLNRAKEKLEHLNKTASNNKTKREIAQLNQQIVQGQKKISNAVLKEQAAKEEMITLVKDTVKNTGNKIIEKASNTLDEIQERGVNLIKNNSPDKMMQNWKDDFVTQIDDWSLPNLSQKYIDNYAGDRLKDVINDKVTNAIYGQNNQLQQNQLINQNTIVPLVDNAKQNDVPLLRHQDNVFIPLQDPNNVVPLLQQNNTQNPPPNNQATFIGPSNNSNNNFVPNTPPQYPPNNQATFIGPPNNQPKADPFADVINDLRQNQDNFNNNRGRQNIPQGGANNNQTANNFDTGFNDPNGMSNRINDLSSSTGGNNQSTNNPNINNDPSGNVVKPPYKPTNNYQNNYNGSYTGTFKGTQSHAIDPKATQYGAQQGSYGSINYGAQNGIVAINWSGNISFTINGTNISGYIRINGINGINQQWQGTIDLQSGQFRANDNTISGTINNNRASGIVAPSSTFEAYKQ